MKQENLDELRNIYLGLVTGGEGPELLSEAPKLTPFELSVRDTFSGKKLRDGLSYTQTPEFKKSLRAGTPGNTSGTPVQNPAKAAVPVKPEPAKPKPFEYNKTNLGTEQDAAFRAGGGNASVGDAYTAADVVARGRAALKAKAAAGTQRPAAGTPAAGTPAAAPVTPTTAPRPAASGPVLSKLDGVEGTGVGANFKEKAFTDTERTRYSSVAAAKPAIPTGTTAGGTTFQRRTPTSAELGAAQASRAAGGSEESAIKAGVGASKPVAPVGDKFGTTSTIKPSSPTQVKSDTPTTQLTKMQPSSSDNSGETDRLKKALDIKKSDVTSSYQWPSIKTVRDIADAYTDIYEKHNDGNLANNYPPYNKVTRGDVIAGATGNDEMGGNDKMGRKKKKKPSNKKRMNPYLKAINSDFEMWIDGLLNEGYDLSNYTWNEVYEIYENAIVLTEEEYGIYSLVLEHLLSNGYAETEHDANIIIENMSDKWVDVIIDEAYKGGPEFGMKYSKSKPLSGEKGDGSGYGPPEKFTKPDDKIEKPGTTVPPFKKGGYGRIMSNIPHGIGPHRDKTASRITTITGKDPGAPTSQKMRAPDKKRLSREIVRKKPQA